MNRTIHIGEVTSSSKTVTKTVALSDNFEAVRVIEYRNDKIWSDEISILSTKGHGLSNNSHVLTCDPDVAAEIGEALYRLAQDE
jgi:hypothetical protein